MKDIEALKKKHQKELEYALLENKLSELVPERLWKSMYVFDAINTKSKPHRLVVGSSCSSAEGKLDGKELGQMFLNFPVTEKNCYDENLDYRFRIDNSVHGTSISVSWISNDLEVACYIKMDEMESFLAHSRRRLASYEVAALRSRVRNYRQLAESYPCRIFGSGAQTQYQGGAVVCRQDSLINTMVEHFKYQAEHGEE